MPLKRQWFRPGRRIELIASSARIRSLRDATLPTRPAGATVAAAGALTATRRGWLPRAAESAGALFSLTISIVMVVAIVALLFAFMREVRRDTTAAHSSVELKPASERG
jgi:hypothetical protein